MAVAINFKICDNAEECSGVSVCKTGALSWDEKAKSIKIDNSKCTSCGLCQKACMVNAIFVAKSESELKKIEREIDEDSRTVSDLYVDRYGGMPIIEAFSIKDDVFKTEVENANKLVAAEIYINDSIECLVRSIPIKSLLGGLDVKYRKVLDQSGAIKDKYEIEAYPTMLFFKSGKLIGKIEGYFDKTQESELRDKVAKITEAS